MRQPSAFEYIAARLKSVCIAFFFSLAAQTIAEVTTFGILPSSTDPRIRTFESPHFIYVNREIVVDHNAALPAERHTLLLWLPGTGGSAAGAGEFCRLAANQGYHVISLMYPNSIPAAVCQNDQDEAAFEKFRLAVIEGGETEHISIEPPESIQSRLLSLLLFIQDKRPREDWTQFLTASNTLSWASIAVAGQSQGGGHAALIAIKHRVARVICTGAPKDYSKALDAPAAWYLKNSATPKDRFFVFNHVSDPIGCTPVQLLKNIRTLELHMLGSDPVDVTKTVPPYEQSRILFTSFPVIHSYPLNSAKGLLEAKEAHTSVIAEKYMEHTTNAWLYMLTAPID